MASFRASSSNCILASLLAYSSTRSCWRVSSSLTLDNCSSYVSSWSRMRALSSMTSVARFSLLSSDSSKWVLSTCIPCSSSSARWTDSSNSVWVVLRSSNLWVVAEVLFSSETWSWSISAFINSFTIFNSSIFCCSARRPQLAVAVCFSSSALASAASLLLLSAISFCWRNSFSTSNSFLASSSTRRRSCAYLFRASASFDWSFLALSSTPSLAACSENEVSLADSRSSRKRAMETLVSSSWASFFASSSRTLRRDVSYSSAVKAAASFAALNAFISVCASTEDNSTSFSRFFSASTSESTRSLNSEIWFLSKDVSLSLTSTFSFSAASSSIAVSRRLLISLRCSAVFSRSSIDKSSSFCSKSLTTAISCISCCDDFRVLSISSFNFSNFANSFSAAVARTICSTSLLRTCSFSTSRLENASFFFSSSDARFSNFFEAISRSFVKVVHWTSKVSMSFFATTSSSSSWALDVNKFSTLCFSPANSDWTFTRCEFISTTLLADSSSVDFIVAFNESNADWSATNSPDFCCSDTDFSSSFCFSSSSLESSSHCWLVASSKVSTTEARSSFVESSSDCRSCLEDSSDAACSFSDAR